MPDCNATQLEFAPFKRRRVAAEFSGGDVSSDGGVSLLRQLERRLGLLQRAASLLNDPRDPERVTHRVADILKQRVFAFCQGCEDLNDHGELRRDVLSQTAPDCDTALAAAPTLCRCESRASRAAAWAAWRAASCR